MDYASLAAGGIIALGVVIAFLIGSIPDGLIVGRLVGGIDIRKHGSGNIGTTNTLRIMGWKSGALVMVLDIAKGVLGTLAMLLLLHAASTNMADTLGALAPSLSAGYLFDWGMGLSMLAASVGHMYSPWLKFKGGKGIATSFGGFCVVQPWCAVAALAAFVGLIAITKHVSVGSLAGAIAYFVVTLAVYNQHLPLIIISVVLTALVFFAHRGNIVRLIHGEERTLSAGTKETAEEAREEEREELLEQQAAAVENASNHKDGE